MNIKKRDMKLSGFHENEKVYYSKTINDGNLKGVMSIIKFFDVKEPTVVKYNFKEAKIVDSFYTWIQFAFLNENFWIKAMYDEKDNLVEVYIDITKENFFKDLSNPEYEDLFLDIVIPPKGHIYQMDEVELMKAKTEKLITDEEYKNAKKVAKTIISYISTHHQEFLDFLWKTKLELDYELEHNNIRK